MKKNYLLYLLTFLLIPLTTNTVVDPNTCGNKHKNLVILDDILKNDPHAQVPAFLGISTGRIEQFLRTHDNDIFDLYALFVEKMRVQKQYFFKKALHALKRTFWRHKARWYQNDSPERVLDGIQSLIMRSFGFNFSFTQEELDFFEKVKQEGKFLMVRSTGVEDSAQVPNAGGNASIAYVKPEIADIQQAMGEVVASYFGMQSLKNRIEGGETLSATELTIPILIQELIGEPLGGATDDKDIPVSGVAYTTNQSISGNNFAITEIDAAYGHGEGVVANKVTTDRYYLKPSRVASNNLSIYPILYEKRERLVPYQKQERGQETVGLKALQNDYSLSHNPALSQEQLIKLYNTLKLIEQSYQQPMDIEFVIVDEKIYIVQARPAMYKPANPSYFAIEALTPQSTNFEKIPSFTIVPGTGTAHIITNPRDIIVTRTLDEADQMPNSAQAKVVIVSTWASSLSHAAVNFMSHGTPCIFIQNKTTVDNWLKKVSSRHPLIIDIQRGFIGYWESTRQKAETLIRTGWFEHPVERALSLYLNDAQLLPAGTPHIPKDPAIMNLMQQLKITPDFLKRRELLKNINDRVETIINLTEKRIAKTHFDFGVPGQKALQEFKKVYRNLIVEYTAAINQGAELFEFLFYHKMLEALLYQVHEQQRILSAYTYTSFLNEIYEKQLLQRIIAKNTSTHAHELGYIQYCPQEHAQQWVNTVLMIDHVQAISQNMARDTALFFEFLHNLEDMGSLSLWLATVFYQWMGNDHPTEEKVMNLVSYVAQDYSSQNIDFLRDIKNTQGVITLLKSQIGKGFNTLSQAEYRWNEIIRLLIDPLTAASFITSFNAAPFFFKIVACSMMKDCIDIVDGTIKELKASTAISMNERIRYFKTMLDGFNTLFKTWINEIMPEEAIPYHSNYSLRVYCEKMESLYQEIMGSSNDSSMFQKSEAFSVNAAMIGTNTAFHRHFPASAEDIFMLIHQNTLVAVAATMSSLLSTKPLNELLYLPPFLNACREAIEKYQETRSIIPIGIDYNADKIILSYNIPLRNHSGACQLMYNTITQECSCAVQFLGQARTRWASIDLIARLSPQLSGLTFAQEVHFDETAGIVEWSWNVERTALMPTILQYINYMSYISMSNDININDLYPLYKGAGSAKQEVRKALENEGSNLARRVLEQVNN